MSVNDIVPRTFNKNTDNDCLNLNYILDVNKLEKQIRNNNETISNASSTSSIGGEERNVDGSKKSTICIDKSNDVVIGPVTRIHGPITIHQELPQIINHHNIEITEEKSTDKFRRCSYYGIGVIILLLAILITIISFINAWKQTEVGDLIENDYNGDVMLKGGHRIFEKYDWGGRSTDYNNQTNKLVPFKLIRIETTGRRNCDTYATCSTIMQELQSNQVNNGYVDILWNFVVGGDGNVYVGRGWNVSIFDNTTMGIGMIGRNMWNESKTEVREAITELIGYGVILNEIDSDYITIDEFNSTINITD